MKKIFFVFLSFLSWSTLIAEAPNPNKPYIVGSLLGQLGNHLFEIATTCALAWDHDAEPYFPEVTNSLQEYQHLFFRCHIRPPKTAIEFEWGVPCYGFSPIPYRPNMKLSGYCQNEKYFAHQRQRLLQLFAPHPKDLSYIKKKYAGILNHPNSVSIHLRYYYREKPDEPSFIQYDQEYFEKAMALFPASSLFVVTSDNMEFAKKNIPTEGKNVVFIEKEPFYIDFFLQSLCKHNIICNSSFSWWSAWLNQNPNKIVVRPKRWMEGYPDIGGPDEWIKIEAKGMQEKSIYKKS